MVFLERSCGTCLGGIETQTAVHPAMCAFSKLKTLVCG